jgi:hypothetical protein
MRIARLVIVIEHIRQARLSAFPDGGLDEWLTT